MSEEIRKMGIVEEILESILGTSEKEIFGYEIDSIIKLHIKFLLEYEINLKLQEIKVTGESGNYLQLITELIKDYLSKGIYFSNLK